MASILTKVANVFAVTAITSSALAQQILDPPLNQPHTVHNVILPNSDGTRSGHDVAVYFTTIYLKRDPDTKTVLAVCHNDCNGKKHPSHDKCDLSCDIHCVGDYGPELHQISAPLFLFATADKDGNPLPNSDYVTQINRDFEKYGLPTLTNANVFVPPTSRSRDSKDGLWHDFIPQSDRPSELPFWARYGYYENLVHHWNQTPCSSSPLVGTVRHYLVRIDYSINTVQNHSDGKGGFEQSDPDPTITDQGPKGAFYLLESVLVPGSVAPGPPVVHCLCDPKPQDTPVEHGYIPGTSPLDEGQAYVKDDSGVRPMLYSDLNHLVGDIVVPNMNHALFTPASWLTSTYHIPAGWQLQSESGTVQNVQIQDGFTIGPAGIDDFLASLNPKYPDIFKQDPIDIRVLCMNMLRHEPNAKEKFRLVPPTNPALTKLAQITHGSRFRGPWDQIRLWIATDHATYDDIGKLLRPLPTRARYLFELVRCIDAGAISASDPYLPKMIKVQDLLEDGVDGHEAQWLTSYQLEKDPKLTRSFLVANATKLPSEKNLKLPDRNQIPNRLTAVAQALLATGDPNDVKTLKEVLSKLPADLQDPEKCDAAFLAAHSIQ